jgi:septum formation inhibitor-activating ATPase MinD
MVEILVISMLDLLDQVPLVEEMVVLVEILSTWLVLVTETQEVQEMQQTKEAQAEVVEEWADMDLQWIMMDLCMEYGQQVAVAEVMAVLVK